MNWLEHNEADATIRGRYDLSPLDTAPIVEQDLIDEVTAHNQVAHEINARFDALAEARDAMNRDDDWSGHDAQAIIAERQRVVAESWDVLVLLRRWVEERMALTRKIAAHIGGQMDELTERHDTAFQAVHQKLERENRRYLKTQPHLARPWITEQAEADEEVSDLRQQIDALDQIRQGYVSIRRKLEQNAQTLTIRQREVFAYLN
jgi:hypothetical protein